MLVSKPARSLSKMGVSTLITETDKRLFFYVASMGFKYFSISKQFVVAKNYYVKVKNPS